MNIYRKLSECVQGTFAFCQNCGEVFIDDVPTIGTIYCPNPDCRRDGWALFRCESETTLLERMRGQVKNP